MLSSTTELCHSVGGPVWCSNAVCRVAWEARVVDRMPYARVLMPYRANKECSLFVRVLNVLRLVKLLAAIDSPPVTHWFTRGGGGASITRIPAEREDSAGFY